MKTHLLLSFTRFCLSLSFTFHLSIAISPFTSSTSTLQSGRFVTRLIHRDSLLSLMHSKDYAVSDRAKFALKSSVKRLAHLKAIVNGAFIPYIEGSLVPSPEANNFFLNISVGEPAVPQLLIFDTGSGLLWVQCAPCPSCSKIKKPQYNPRKSSTYAPITCHPTECREKYRGNCDSNGYCEYAIRYKDGSNSSGTIAFEKFMFHAYMKASAIMYNVIFGCATKYRDVNTPLSNGIIGVNGNQASILTAIGSTFSYCIGSINDPHYLHNFLILGDGAILDGNLTPIQIRRGLFLVTLKGITVNHKQLIANPEEFKFKVIVDSGSTISFLARSLYEPLKAEVLKILKNNSPPLRRVVYKRRPDLLCYMGILERDLLDFPVTFHLPGIDTDVHLPGVDIELNRETMFLQADKDAFCMAVDASDDGVNILGVWTQQYSNIGFDLLSKRMSFRAADCEFVAKSL